MPRGVREPAAPRRRLTSYDRVSAEYRRGRPGYAAAAVAHVLAELGLAPGDVALDAAGLRTIALDPSAAMLEELRDASPRTATLLGTAEAVPLPDGAVDLVTAGQAFHWFDAPAALREFRRVLRAGGGLALLWNRRNPDDPVQQLLAELTDPAERATPRGWQLDTPALVAASGLFAPASTATFAHDETTDADGLADRLRSSSFVAGLPRERRDELERRLRARVDATAGIVLHHLTVVYVARALLDGSQGGPATT